MPLLILPRKFFKDLENFNTNEAVREKLSGHCFSLKKILNIRGFILKES